MFLHLTGTEFLVSGHVCEEFCPPHANNVACDIEIVNEKS